MFEIYENTYYMLILYNAKCHFALSLSIFIDGVASNASKHQPLLVTAQATAIAAKKLA